MLLKALLLLVLIQIFVEGVFYVSAIRRMSSEEMRNYIEFSDVIVDEISPSEIYLSSRIYHKFSWSARFLNFLME
jgi:hypothetical protein